MQLNKKILIAMVALGLAIGISACGPTTTPEPTIDPNIIKTEAIETAYAQITLEAIMNPSATPEPTQTPIPTDTPEPTMTNTVAAALPGISTSSANLPSVATQPVNAEPTKAVGDKAEWVSQTPEDGTKMYIRNVDSISPIFDIYWRVRNIGTTTWNDTYKLRYYTGDKFFRDYTEFKFPEGISVAPGETADLKIVGSRPYTAGTYTSTWVMTNPDGQNFYVLTITIDVINDFPPKD